MNHQQINNWLPQYAAGTLQSSERQQVETHLRECHLCRADLALWQSVGSQINQTDHPVTAPSGMADRALARIRQPQRRSPRFHLPAALQHAYALTKNQLPLVRSEIWVSSAIVMAMGYFVAVIAGKEVVISAVAPLIAAACIAAIYGPDNDPAIELALSTPTSPRQVLLARLALVFGYNLVLAVAASAALLPVLPDLNLASIILSWLGPMTFLSTLALVLSQIIGTGNAISLAYAAWFGQLITRSISASSDNLTNSIPAFRWFVENYNLFWTSPLLLLVVSAAMLAAVLLTISRQERSLPTWA